MYMEIYHPYSWYIINYGINAFFPSSIYVYQVVWANTTTSTQSIFYGIQYYVASFLHHRCLKFLTYNGYRTHFRPNIGRKINSGIFFIIYKYEWYFMYDMSDICCIKRIVYACRYFMRYTGLVNVWMWVLVFRVYSPVASNRKKQDCWTLNFSSLCCPSSFHSSSLKATNRHSHP